MRMPSPEQPAQPFQQAALNAVALEITVRRLAGLPDDLVGRDPLPVHRLLLHNKNSLLKQLGVGRLDQNDLTGDPLDHVGHFLSGEPGAPIFYP